VTVVSRQERKYNDVILSGFVFSPLIREAVWNAEFVTSACIMKKPDQADRC
jgi:hypothetical protein